MEGSFFDKVRRNAWKHIFRHFVSDETYLRGLYRSFFGRPLNLDHPQTYCEKLQWLKLYDRHPEYGTLVDKEAVKTHVASLIGEEHIIPTYGVWDRPEDIDYDSLPDDFVLKATHNSGCFVICHDKTKLDKQRINKKFRRALKADYADTYKEYPYAYVKPRIIAEKYMEDESGELRDYKFFCFDGKPELMFVALDRQKEGEETKFDFYDMDFRHLPITNGHPNSPVAIPKPKSFEKMKEIAAILSKGYPHVRIDLYDINGQIYFGEYTFFHWSGIIPFDPSEWDLKMGSMIRLPQREK
ncbi:MAG: glycosyl transferase [Bacteroidales bacterium]|nr:glycosyl transferase [Bacteroidales bacterium]